MRKIFKSFMLVAAAAMAFTSCQKEEAAAPETVSATLTMHADVEQTKTYLGEGNKVLWGKDEAVKLYVGAGETAKFVSSTSADSYEGKETASFQFSITDVGTTGPYNLGGIYPASAAVKDNDDAASFKVVLSDIQHAEVGKYDPSAYIMVLKPETVETLPDEYQASFRRATALNKITLTGVKENISKVEITVPEGKYLAGRRHFNLMDGTSGDIYYDKTNSITVNSKFTGESIDVWFCSWGVELAAGEELTVRMSAAENTYTRTISARGDGIAFVEGKLNTLKISMADINPDEQEQPGETTEVWTLVTDASKLAVGDKIVIASASEAFAMSTTQNNNNRGSAAITKSGNVIIVNDDVQVITLQSGTKASTFAFHTEAGYLYAASSSSNHLKTQATLNDNGSWSIEVAETGVATIKAQGTNSRNWLRFNTSNSPKIFSCYGSGQTDVAIYRLTGTSGDEGETPAPETKTLVSIAVSGYTETYTVGDTFEFDGTVTATYDDESTADVTLSSTFTGYDMNSIGSQNVTVSYTENGVTKTTQYDITVNELEQPAEPMVVTVEEFLAAQENDVVYELTGVITSVTNTTYGNFYLNDSTSEVLIYGLCSPEGVEKYWATADVQVGDIITVRTKRTSYNGTPQGKNALFVSSVNFDINPTDINVKAEDTTTEFNLSCEVGYDIQYPDGVNELSEVIDNNTASVTYSVEFPANTGAETKTYVIKIIADPNLILETPIEGVEYARNVTITQAAKPAEGEDAEPAWTLVTDVNDLAAGDQIVIVAKNANYAMSTTQNSNNRAHAAVTKNGNIITFGSDVQIMTLEVGNTSGTYAFNTGSGYLYAASSSKNYLRTETKLSANSSWTIAIASTGVATIKSTGSYSRNWLRYNSSNNPPIFSCYSSGQTDVCIYKLK